MKIKILVLIISLFGIISFFATDTGETGYVVSNNRPIKHEKWDALLKKHVDSDGWVDYKGFEKDRALLNEYLNLLSKNPPDERMWTKKQQIAYWINAYNAFTVKLIIDNYPLESIKDIQLNIPGVYTVWHKEFFNIGGEKTSLDEIEHKILRKKFNEPRIHFAIVCASVSCPPLRNEAFESKKLEFQLLEQSKRFINDPGRNLIRSERIVVSKIFSWFKGDFTKGGSLIDFLNKYSTTQIDKKAKVEFMEYDWGLNEKKGF